MTRQDYLRKAEQAYEMAGLAAQDGDKADAAKWLKLAKEFDEKARRERE